MNSKFIYLNLIVAVLLFSCGKSQLTEPHIDEEDLPHIDTATFNIISFSLPQEIQQEPYFLIGYGYDAKENLLVVSNGLREKILDTDELDKKSYLIKSRYANGFSGYYENYSKEIVLSKLVLHNNFSNKASFSSETDILKNLPESNITLNNISTITHMYDVMFYRPETEFLNKEYIDYVENHTPAEIVKKYGTHLIISCSRGASVNNIKYIQNKKVLKDKIINEWNSYLFATGADLSKLKINSIKNSIDISIWLETLTEENGDFVDFGRDEPIPIYETISNKQKQTEVKNYIEEYVK